MTTGKTIALTRWTLLLLLLLSHFSHVDPVWPQRWQPTRLLHPWDSPGKNTGVGCHFLLQCMKVKSQREAAQACPTPSDPMDSSLPGSSVHGIFQARILEWGAIALDPSKKNRYPFVKELANRIHLYTSFVLLIKWKSLSHVRLFVTPWMKQSMEFSRPEYQSG